MAQSVPSRVQRATEFFGPEGAKPNCCHSSVASQQSLKWRDGIGRRRAVFGKEAQGLSLLGGGVADQDGFGPGGLLAVVEFAQVEDGLLDGMFGAGMADVYIYSSASSAIKKAIFRIFLKTVLRPPTPGARPPWLRHVRWCWPTSPPPRAPNPKYPSANDVCDYVDLHIAAKAMFWWTLWTCCCGWALPSQLFRTGQYAPVSRSGTPVVGWLRCIWADQAYGASAFAT